MLQRCVRISCPANNIAVVSKEEHVVGILSRHKAFGNLLDSYAK